MLDQALDFVVAEAFHRAFPVVRAGQTGRAPGLPRLGLGLVVAEVVLTLEFGRFRRHGLDGRQVRAG